MDIDDLQAFLARFAYKDDCLLPLKDRSILPSQAQSTVVVIQPEAAGVQHCQAQSGGERTTWLVVYFDTKPRFYISHFGAQGADDCRIHDPECRRAGLPGRRAGINQGRILSRLRDFNN